MTSLADAARTARLALERLMTALNRPGRANAERTRSRRRRAGGRRTKQLARRSR